MTTEQKPNCAVGGLIRPGAMCSKVIVGGKLCGAQPGTCPHQRQQTPDGVQGLRGPNVNEPPTYPRPPAPPRPTRVGEVPRG